MSSEKTNAVGANGNYKFEKNEDKLYRFVVLQNAIEFFSQRFDIATLTDFTYHFLNETLTLNCSALFIYNKDTDCFDQTKNRNYKVTDYVLKSNEEIRNIPRYVGDIIYKNINRFFSEEFIETFNISLVIPLFYDVELVGLFIADGKAMGDFIDEDYGMASSLMKLFSSSLERTEVHKELEAMKSKRETSDFNLYTMNKSFRAIVSEIELDKLLSVSIDVFAELTKSTNTSFGVYVALLNSIVVKSYRSVSESDFNPIEMKFELNPQEYKGDKIILEIEKDKEIINQIFKNPDDFKKLGCKYVVLIVKEKILGFVTLGETMTGYSYTKEIFELTESLAITSYIALNNAILFNELLYQKQSLEKQYRHMLETSISHDI